MGQIASVNTDDGMRNDESSMTTRKESKIPPPSHPLLIEIILDKLLAVVNKEDLPACRLVCKMWNSQSIPQVRSEFEIYLRLSLYPDAQSQSLKKFVGLMRTSMDPPYAKFRMYWSKTEGSARFIHEFFSTWGPEFTHLTLDNWTFDKSPHGHSRPGAFSIENFDALIQFSTNLEYLRVQTPLIFQQSPPLIFQIQELYPWIPRRRTPRMSALKMRTAHIVLNNRTAKTFVFLLINFSNLILCTDLILKRSNGECIKMLLIRSDYSVYGIFGPQY